MTTNYYLERRKSRKRADLHIILFIREHRQLLKVGTGEHIVPKDWDMKRQRPRSGTQGAEELTDLLDAWESEVNAVRRSAKASGITASIEYLKRHLSFIRAHDGTFWSVWDEYVKQKSKRVSQKAIEAYKYAHRTLCILDGTHPGLHDASYSRYKSMDRERDFIRKYGAYRIDFAAINNSFVNKLVDFATFMGFTNLMADLTLTRVKAFLNWAYKNEYIRDDSFKNLATELQTLGTDENILYLLPEELAHLTHLRIENEPLARIRDIFCFQAYTGLRYGDITTFRKDYINEDSYRLTQRKNKKAISNPLFEPAREILDKYADLPGPYILPTISTPAMNMRIKEMAKLAGLDRKVTLTRVSGAERIQDTLPLYSAISTHVARKTFITYLINSGLDRNIVRAYTGQSADVIDRYFEIHGRYKDEQAAKLNKQYRQDAENGRKLRKA